VKLRRIKIAFASIMQKAVTGCHNTSKARSILKSLVISLVPLEDNILLIRLVKNIFEGRSEVPSSMMMLCSYLVGSITRVDGPEICWFAVV